MGGSKKEFKNAGEEGAEFIYNVALKEIIINSENQIIGAITQNTMVKNGKVELLKQSENKLDADVIIFALGFSPKTPSFLAQNAIQCDEWGCVIVDENFQTTQKGIYAGGDCQRGASLVVSSAADGRKAAQSIIKELL